MTSVVDASYRKSPAKPPVLTPKPNPSEIVKRLSFKRDGLETPAVEDKAKLAKPGREEGSQASSNGTGEVVVNESRVSSMIARLSNGVRPEELNTNTSRQAERKQFLSKFINNNDKPSSSETKQEIPDPLAGGSGATVDVGGVREKEVEEAGEQEVSHSNIPTNGLDTHSPAGAAKVYNESSSPKQLR